MSKKYVKRGLLAAAFAAAGFGSSSAFAVDLPVIDAANLVVNTVDAAFNGVDMVIDYNIYLEMQKARQQLIDIKDTLTDKSDGTILYYTANIDDSTTNIDKSTQNIDKSTTEIVSYEKKNYDITKTFYDITNNYYGVTGGGDIPTSLKDSLSDQVKDASSYNDADSYVQSGIAKPENLTDVGVKASANQKSANDALVAALSAHGDSLEKQMNGIKQLAEEGVKVEGHGNQLAYANAIAGAQAVQLIEMREMMLAAENARAAKVQAEADTKSRQVAATKSLREGLAGGKGAISISSDISQSPVSKGNF